MRNEQVDKVKNMKRIQLLSTNKRTIQNCIPVPIAYKRYLPNISKVIRKTGIFYKYQILVKKYFTRTQ